MGTHQKRLTEALLTSTHIMLSWRRKINFWIFHFIWSYDQDDNSVLYIPSNIIHQIEMMRTMKALCNEAPHGHELNSASRGI